MHRLTNINNYASLSIYVYLCMYKAIINIFRFSARNSNAAVTVRSTIKALAEHAQVLPEFGTVSECIKLNMEAGKKSRD